MKTKGRMVNGKLVPGQGLKGATVSVQGRTSVLVNADDDGNDQYTVYDEETPAPNVTVNSFTIPFPMEDLTFNPHLKEDPIHVDVRATYSS